MGVRCGGGAVRYGAVRWGCGAVGVRCGGGAVRWGGGAVRWGHRGCGAVGVRCSGGAVGTKRVGVRVPPFERKGGGLTLLVTHLYYVPFLCKGGYGLMLYPPF